MCYGGGRVALRDRVDNRVDTIPGSIIFQILFKLAPDSLPPPDLFDHLLDSIWRGIAAR